jgi:hypothetical protein
MNESQQLIAGFIPRIEELIRKEQKHLVKMKRMRMFLWDKTTVDEVILRSERDLSHYRFRLQQYRQYAQ